MTDYKQEQEDELEALESIYVTEMELISDIPYVFTIVIPCEIQNVEVGGPSKEFNVGLKFSLPAEYPDIPPEIEWTDTGEFDEDSQKAILIDLHKKAEEEVGCAMVFTLVSEMQDKANDYAEELYNKKLKEKEDKEAVPAFFGTIVTRENFMEWREKFIVERNMGKVKVVLDKLTGRQIFMMNNGKIDEIQIEEAIIAEGDDIEVDESLFDEDIDLDGDFSDDESDEDYVPE